MDAGLTNEADVCADNWADPGDDREEERGEPENTHSIPQPGQGDVGAMGETNRNSRKSQNFILNEYFFMSDNISFIIVFVLRTNIT